MQRLQRWAKNNLGHFVVSQLSHTLITAVILGTLFFGAARVGALDGMLAPLAQTTDTSFTTIHYQGRLANPDGTPISDTLTFKFSLYDAPTDGNLLWGPESHDDVPVSDGLFSVRLGQYDSLPPTLFNGGDVWLEIVVKGETLSPCEKLAAVPYAMVASEALTVPDGSITQAKLGPDVDFTLDDGEVTTDKIANDSVTAAKIAAGAVGSEEVADGSLTGTDLGLNGDLNLGSDSSTNGHIIGDYSNLMLTNQTGNIRLRSAEHLFFFIDANNDSSGSVFKVIHNEDEMGDIAETLMTLKENGNLSIRGSLSQGALIENNLQTPAELAAEQIERFSEGDVLCWSEDRLELCSQPGDPLVQAVADANGKPIVIGAEVIKVLGPVQWGDMLVASEVAGYAVAVENPAPGTVIAQALEDFDGEQGIIKAMIRKF